MTSIQKTMEELMAVLEKNHGPLPMDKINEETENRGGRLHSVARVSDFFSGGDFQFSIRLWDNTKGKV